MKIDESRFVRFYKMSGSNDLSSLTIAIFLYRLLICRFCSPDLSKGLRRRGQSFSDQTSEVTDSWRFWLGNQHMAEMCGNGSRAARFPVKQYCRTKNVHRNGSRHCYRRGFDDNVKDSAWLDPPAS